MTLVILVLRRLAPGGQALTVIASDNLGISTSPVDDEEEEDEEASWRGKGGGGLATFSSSGSGCLRLGALAALDALGLGLRPAFFRPLPLALGFFSSSSSSSLRKMRVNS